MKEPVVFMGTPEFAVPSARVLLEDFNLVCVVTQPDRPRGRGRKVQPSPVARLALEHNIPLLRPDSIKEPQVFDTLRDLQPAVVVVAAFGQIIPPSMLALPSAGCVNVHASLLPRWRGAAPVAAAILAGDEQTGVTLMKMDAGLDTGPILVQVSTSIRADDTRQSLTERLGHLGAGLLRDRLADWLAGRIEPIAQDPDQATFAPQLIKGQGRIDWKQSALQVARQVNAFYPWPGAFTQWKGQPLKILRAQALPADDLPDIPNNQAPLGAVIAAPSGPLVITGEGLLLLQEIQPAGKRAMPAPDFARGARDFVGSRLGD